MTNTIINTNGREYQIIRNKEEYTLLKDEKAQCQPYIVVWNLQEYKNGWSWGQGHYFSELQDAKTYFNRL